jgi:hypothetical protein
MQSSDPNSPLPSGSARPNSSAGEASAFRAKRLAAIREEIESGTYETTERLEAALSRFLVEVGAHS